MDSLGIAPGAASSLMSALTGQGLWLGLGVAENSKVSQLPPCCRFVPNPMTRTGASLYGFLDIGRARELVESARQDRKVGPLLPVKVVTFPTT